MTFPIVRPRRLRRNDALRRLVRETHVNTDGLIMPFFVVHGEGIKSEIEAMPPECD